MNTNVKVVETFNKFAEQYTDFTFTNLLQYELNKFISLIPKQGKILDVGCGAGRDVQYFMDESLDVLGIDAADKLIGKAKELVPNGKFEVMNMENINFQWEFDGIWALDAISYLPKDNILDVLTKFNKSLKDQGVLFISVREGEGEDVLKHEKLGKEEIPIAFFKKEELEEMLKETGFDVSDSYTEEGEHFTWINVFAKKS
tara:strand:+ start:175 stop:777 length:603 start_codon:yes stop_codon:yes gene_type:complete